MAKRTITSLLDDYEAKQGNGDIEADETVEFGIDGKTYEIDLSNANASGLRSSLEDYVAAARPKSTRGGRKASAGTSTGSSAPKTSGSSSADREKNKEIRAFWKQAVDANPTAVPPFAERGRIPDTVSELFSKTGGEVANIPSSGVESGPSQPVAPVQSGLDNSVAQDVDSSGDDEENLPEGWTRDDNGDLHDEAGFFKDEDELAEELNRA